MEVEISLGAVRYPFRLGTDWIAAITRQLAQHNASRYLVVCDTNTAPLIGEELVDLLSVRAPANLVVVAAGEVHKDLTAVSSVIESALAAGADRASMVVAVGGGVLGNIAGLAAALMFRGIRLAHVPTSLVAMLDSVLSLKQAVNASYGKNLVGTFYAPVEVLADTALLRTLPHREMVSGLCEVVKNALAIRPSMTDLLSAGLRPDGQYDDATLRAIIEESILAKASVTVDDSHESRAGLVLEYGHTVGHALEYTAAGALSHGEAVGLGMLAAAEVSHRMGRLDAGTVALHRRLLGQAGAMLRIPDYLDVDAALHRLTFDNKRGYLPAIGDNSAMVLLAEQGVPIWSDGRPLTPAPLALVGEVVRELAQGEVDETELLGATTAAAVEFAAASGGPSAHPGGGQR